MTDEASPRVVDRYPDLYTFRIIVRRTDHARDHVRRLVQGIVGSLPDDALLVKESHGGKYLSVRLSCLLQSEEQRHDVYRTLFEDNQVVMSL